MKLKIGDKVKVKSNKNGEHKWQIGTLAIVLHRQGLGYYLCAKLDDSGNMQSINESELDFVED